MEKKDELLKKIESKLKELAYSKKTIGYKKLAEEVGLMDEKTNARRPPRILYDILLIIGQRNYQARGPINGLVVRVDTKISGRGFWEWFVDKYDFNIPVHEIMNKQFYTKNVKDLCFKMAESKF